MNVLIRRTIAVGATVVLVAVGASCGSGDDTTSSTLHADYPGYATLDELYAASDVVVAVDIAAAPIVRELYPSVGGTDPQANPNAGTNETPAGDSVVITVFDAKVTEVFKGEANEDDTIAVKQLGGLYKGVRHTEVGATPLKPHTSYVLFLATFPDAPASLLNPGQGQYPVDVSTGELSPLPGNPITFTVPELRRISDG